MAVEDVGELAAGVRVEVVFPDHQNKPDVGAEIARRWLDTDGGDTINAVKQAREFGLVAGGQRLAALLNDVSVVNALGLETAQALRFVEPFYWDLNDGTRAFGKRFAARMGGRMPTQEQAGVYG